MPLFFPTGDETLDPTRLVMLPLRPRPLIGALLVASLVGIGPLFTLCAADRLGRRDGARRRRVVVGGHRRPARPAVCVALARAVATANIRLLTSRKGRDLAVLSGLVIAVGAQVVNFGAQRLSGAGGLSALDPAGRRRALAAARVRDRRGGLGERGRVRAGRGPTAAVRGRPGRAAVRLAAVPGEADDLPRRLDARRPPSPTRKESVTGLRRGCCPRGARARSCCAACGTCGATRRRRRPG